MAENKTDEKGGGNRPKVSAFKVIRYGFKFVIGVFPAFFIGINIISVFHGVSFGVTTLMTQRFYDAVADALSAGGGAGRAFVFVAVLGAAYVAKDILNGLHNFMHGVAFDKLHGRLMMTIHRKMAQIDPVCLEDVKLHDDIEKAVAGSETVMHIINIGITIFTFYLPYFIFMGIYLHSLKPQFIIAIVLVFVPVLLCQMLRTGIVAKFEDKAAPVRREYDYYLKAITDREYFKETRLLGAYGFFIGRLMDALRRLSGAEWTANKRTNLLEFCMSLLSAAGYAGIILMLVRALLAGEITVGAFAAVFSSIGFMFAIMREMINTHFGNIATNMGKAHNFIRFMELPERIGQRGEPSPGLGIEAKGVAFAYPGAEKNSVDGVTIKINAGETVAIVGENGAGKSTLVKLLTGLYAPSVGSVSLNGLDTSRFGRASIFRNLSGVFQRFQKYQMTLSENVAISEGSGDGKVELALEQAGVDPSGASFPDGVSTMLSREFDGVDLSGGEWQRIAIARGLYRVHDVVVLDEPTAAIDPIEESRIYRKFVEISRGKTAIIVTHRLGSTKIADRVVVMDKGKIDDEGTHQELMRRDGLYSRMFNSQALWYGEEEAATISRAASI